MTQTIIIDTDPGIDDTIAILLALASPDLRVAAITTVAGNVSIEDVTRNARCVVDIAGAPPVPVHRGCSVPLLRPLDDAKIVHGANGLADIALPDPKTPEQADHAVTAIIDIIRREPAKSVTLCTLGPLTNIALALRQAPDLAERVQGIVGMGGAFFAGGNSTPVAEYNFLVDPHAAEIVLSAGIPTVLMPLDVTHKAIATPERIAAFRDRGTKLGAFIAKLLGHYSRHDEDRYGMVGGPLHDPTVTAYMLRPELFSGKAVHVSVETASSLTEGQSVIDWWGMDQGRGTPWITVMNEIDHAGYFDLLLDHIARLPDSASLPDL